MRSLTFTIEFVATTLFSLAVTGYTPIDALTLNLNATNATYLSDLAKHEYIIWPQDGRNQILTDKTTSSIKVLVWPNPVWEYVTLYDGLIWWMTNCTFETASKIGNLPGVADIELNSPVEIDADQPVTAGGESNDGPSQTIKAGSTASLYQFDKRDAVFTTQVQAPTDLRVLSQPSANPNLAAFGNYVYEDTGGEGITIYHIERGIDPTHLDFEPDPMTRESRIRWLFSFSYQQGGWGTETDESRDGHGTCVASKALGSIHGSAKRAKLAVVKMRDYKQGEISSILDLVLRDIVANGLQKRSIVMFSWSSETPVDPINPGRVWARVKTEFERLDAAGVPVVASAGNRGPKAFRMDVDQAPAVLWSDQAPLIIVGNVNNTGYKARLSKGGRKVNVWAPGEKIKCAAVNQGQVGVRTISGTSFSSPQVAGVLATLLSQDPLPFSLGMNTALEVISIRANWARVAGFPVIWNGVTSVDNPPAQYLGSGNSSQRGVVVL